MPRFLILRFSSIGDIVLTTPVVRCLKQQVPGAEIHYFTKPGFKTILEHNPYISQLHLLDKSLIQKTSELKSLGFDYIIDLHSNLRTRIMKSIIDVPSFSFKKLNIEKSQLVNFKINTVPQLHVVDRYMEILSPFGVINDGAGLDYFLPPGIHHTFQPEQFINGSHYIAFAIGAQHFTKRLPPEKIIALCRSINTNVVLLGGKEDEQTGNDIAGKSGQHVINLCGKLSLHQSAYVVSNAQKVLTHDTGLMHIAAAFKKEIISIWGNTVPEFGMTPYYGAAAISNQKFEIKSLACRPCSKIGYKACPLQHFNCMNLQETAAIASVINQD